MADIYETSKILSAIRTRMHDTVEPYLVSTTTLIELLDMAQREFCEETLCLPSSGDYTAAVTANSEWTKLDARIIQIRRATSVANGRGVEPVTSGEIDQKIYELDYGLSYTSAWQTATGEPNYIITDLRDGYGRLVPIPTASDTLNLDVYRYAKPLEDENDDLEVPDRWRMKLVAGVIAAAYEIEDSELYDPESANKWRELWFRGLDEARERINRDTRGGGIVKAARNGYW